MSLSNVLLIVTVITHFYTWPASGNLTKSFELLSPPHSDITFIVKAFVELQKQWCPPWRYKKLFILNYANDALSEDILIAILKLNEPPKIISNQVGDLSYWTYETRRCAVLMARGHERLDPHTALHHGSRYFIFHPKLKENIFMHELDSGKRFILDRAYHILYNRSSIEIHHKNFFTNQTIQLDPSNIRVQNDLKNLYGRKICLLLPAGNLEVVTFDAYLGETIARQRNGTFEATTSTDDFPDYGVVNMGISFLGSDKILALGSTFISVLVPRSKPKPIIWVLVDPFDYYSWIALFSLVVVLAVVLSLFGDGNKSTVLENAVEMIMCLLGGPSRTYGSWFEKQIITNYCLLSIVIVSCYQSLIFSYLSYTRFFPEINSADEIRNNCIFPRSTTFSNHLNLPLSKPGESLENMCYLFYSRDNTHITTLLIENMRNIDKSAQAAFEHNLRLANTVFLKYHLLYYFFSKSLIRELFPFYIHAFFESGLFDQYYKNKSSFALLYRQDVLAIRAFNVVDVSIIWYLYIGGVIVSFIWLLLEITLYHFQRFARVLKERLRKCLRNKQILKIIFVRK